MRFTGFFKRQPVPLTIGMWVYLQYVNGTVIIYVGMINSLSIKIGWKGNKE